MRLRILKVLLWIVCATHLLSGFAGVCSPAWAVEAARIFHGAQVEATPVNIHLLRIIGAYMIALGVLGGVAALHPEKNRPIIFTIALLLLLRVLQCLVHAEEIHQTFGVSMVRLWGQAGYFTAIAAALMFLMPKRKRT